MSVYAPSQTFPSLSGFATAIRSGLNVLSGRKAVQAFLAAGALVAASASASAMDAYAVEGLWVNKAGDAIVKVSPCTNSHARLCGDVVWAESGAKVSIGDRVLTGFRVDGNKSGDRWTQGKVSLNGKKGQKGKLRFSEDTLKVGSCRGSKCKNVTWTRPSATQTAQAGLNGAE